MSPIFDLIEWLDESGSEIVQRVPEVGSGEFRLGSQVVVRESQRAVFVRDGRALDVLPPGRHTLSTLNVPLLADLVGLAFGGQSPFRAEVVFVSMKQFLDLKWGTPQPILYRDSELGMVQLRGFGAYAIEVSDPQLFVAKVVGTQGALSTNDIGDFLRSIIVAELAGVVSGTLTSIVDLPRATPTSAWQLRLACRMTSPRWGSRSALSSLARFRLPRRSRQ